MTGFLIVVGGLAALFLGYVLGVRDEQWRRRMELEYSDVCEHCDGSGIEPAAAEAGPNDR